MTPYKTVLIAIDLDGQPTQVLAKANTLLDTSTKIHVLNVQSDPTYFYTNYAGVSGTMMEDVRSIKERTKINALRTMNEAAEECHLHNIEKRVKFGRAADVIIDQADQLQADLIIVGSHGRHGVHLLLGSTANAVLHHAQCDVLAVRIQEDK